MTQRPSSPPRARQTVGELRCSGCGQAPGNPVHRADVAMTWLVAGIVGPVVRRFCRACIPAGRVDDVVCVRCGDGPLLAGDGEQMPVAVQGWLSAAGWELSGPVCPGCVGELAR